MSNDNSQQNYTIRFPFGDADSFELTASGVQAIDIANNATIIDGASIAATGDRTINLTLDESLQAFSLILVKIATSTESKTIFGTGFSAPHFAGVVGESAQLLFIYDGTNFLPLTAEPSASAVPVVALTATGAQAVEINAQMTIIDGLTTISTATRTINLTIDDTVRKGAKIQLKVGTTGTEHNVHGTGFAVQPDIVGVAGKDFVQTFTYDGTAFYPDGAPYQLN